jgi:hypothetical protein
VRRQRWRGNFDLRDAQQRPVNDNAQSRFIIDKAETGGAPSIRSARARESKGEDLAEMAR